MPSFKKAHKVHVYAGISYYGVTPLIFVHGTTGVKHLPTSVTSEKYIKILQDCLLPAFH